MVTAARTRKSSPAPNDVPPTGGDIMSGQIELALRRLMSLPENERDQWLRNFAPAHTPVAQPLPANAAQDTMAILKVLTRNLHQIGFNSQYASDPAYQADLEYMRTVLKRQFYVAQQLDFSSMETEDSKIRVEMFLNSEAYLQYVTSDGETFRINPAMCRFFGVTEGEALGKFFGNHYGKTKDKDVFHQFVDNVLTLGYDLITTGSVVGGEKVTLITAGVRQPRLVNQFGIGCMTHVVGQPQTWLPIAVAVKIPT